MRGKIVNLCIGFTNILWGILIILFTIFVPQDKTLLTVQESYVVKNILIAIYITLVAIVLIDVIQYYNHRRDTIFNTGYLFGIFALSFIFIKEPIIASFSIISGAIVIYKSLKENLVEIDSTFGISIAVVLIFAIFVISIFSLSYRYIGNKIKNKENQDELAYTQDYFKYITELGIDDVYINVKKDGKFGYINQNGDVVIDYQYDYASPFVKINMYNKHFEIALVCQKGSTYVILKNQRPVLSYRTESSDENYGAKLEELQHIYTNVLAQEGDMQYEIENITSHMNKAPVYPELSTEYTFRYDYNEEYDVIITQSNLGLGDKYELAKKDDTSIRIPLDTTKLAYDKDYLYLYSNGSIPFYEISKLYQGWFTSYGKKNEMQGRAEILEFIEDKILIKNFNDKTIYFINNVGDILSEKYKDIYICNSQKYIVQTNENKYKVINQDFNKIFETEYDVINPRLISQNLYLVMDTSERLSSNDYHYATMKWNLINENGNVLLDNIEQIYDQYYELKSNNDQDYQTFLDKLQDIEYHFVGDQFYTSYK